MEQAEETPAPVEEFLRFPDELHVDDPLVNEFVKKVMETCAAGEYDAFRLLWSAREDPLPRDEFEQGWHAVKGIRIRALKKFRLAAESESDASGKSALGEPNGNDAHDKDETPGPGRVDGQSATGALHPETARAAEEEEVYAIVALVKFDPAHEARQLQEDREVIMMLIREHDQWRLARAPKAVRTWIREGLEPKDEAQTPPPEASQRGSTPP